MQRRCGLPIGNLTSQVLGNLYLDDLDHYLKEELRVPAYLRYVDDLILLDDSKTRLWALRAKIERFLEAERLRLHPRKVQLQPTALGLDVLGYRVFPTHFPLSQRKTPFLASFPLLEMPAGYHPNSVRYPGPDIVL